GSRGTSCRTFDAAPAGAATRDASASMTPGTQRSQRSQATGPLAQSMTRRHQRQSTLLVSSDMTTSVGVVGAGPVSGGVRWRNEGQPGDDRVTVPDVQAGFLEKS